MFDIGGKRFGVIDVREFRKVPHVAKGANDELNRPRLRPGEDYRRPDLVPEHPDRPRKLLALAPPSYRAACDALAAIAGTGGRKADSAARVACKPVASASGLPDDRLALRITAVGCLSPR